MIKLRTSSGIAEIAEVHFRDGSGLDDIGKARIRDAFGLNVIFEEQAALAAVVIGDPYGSNGSDSAISITTSSVGCSATGGKSPYTFLWSRTDSDPASWVIVSPTNQDTAFRAASVGSGVTRTATFKCTVTDSDTPPNTADTSSVTATAENFGGFQ